MNDEQYKDLSDRLVRLADDRKDTDRQVYLLIVETIEALKMLRCSLTSFRDSAASKAYEAIYKRGGWKSDCQAASEAIMSMKISE